MEDKLIMPDKVWICKASGEVFLICPDNMCNENLEYTLSTLTTELADALEKIVWLVHSDSGAITDVEYVAKAALKKIGR